MEMQRKKLRVAEPDSLTATHHTLITLSDQQGSGCKMQITLSARRRDPIGVAYSCYFIDASGRAIDTDHIAAADDTGAVIAAIVALRATGYTSAELWELGRRVGIFDRR